MFEQTTRYYVLDDADRPVYCPDVEVWTRWMESSVRQRSVARHHLGPFLICTTFMGVDHTAGLTDPPLLYETVILEVDGRAGVPNPFEEETWHWYDRREAGFGHREVVRKLKRFLEQNGKHPVLVDVKQLGEREEAEEAEDEAETDQGGGPEW